MTRKLTLRPYQQSALDEIRAYYARGEKRVLLHMATGGGKTLTFCRILEASHKKGKKAIMVVKGIELVENASQRLFREGVPHGVMQGNHWNKRPNENIQVCSVDTLYRRKIAPEADICVWDEAHFCVSPSYKWLIDHYKDAYHLAVTATPHVKKGLKHLANEVVYPISINDLIEQGYLARPRYFAPSKISTKGIRVDSTGDYNNSQLFEAANHTAIYGNIVKSYLDFLVDKPSVCFAVNVSHSKKLAEEFNKAGIRAEHIEADTPPAERQAVLSRLESGETKIVTNCGILLVGVDMPYIHGVIMARPTKSYNLHIQAIGRGTRIHGEKREFIVLDHAGNLSRHGIIEHEKPCILEGWGRGDMPGSEGATTCQECYAVFSAKENYKNHAIDFDEDKALIAYLDDITDGGGLRAFRSKRLYICPVCGADITPERRESQNNEIADELVELDDEQKKHLGILNRVAELKRLQKAKGYKRGWIYWQLKNQYGEETANKYFKRRKVPDWVIRKG